MFRLRWFQVGGAARGMPRRNRAHRKPWPALGLIACLALLQSGCQSGASGSGLCGPCGFFNRVSTRMFSRSNGGCCSPGVVTEGPVEYAAPATVVGPAATVPSYQSGAGMISTPSSVPPPGETPQDLDRIDPLPKSKVVTPPAGTNGAQNSTLPGSRTSYQTRRQDPSTRIARRPVTLPRTTVSTPEPTSRSAQVLARSAQRDSRGADDQDPLDHLPPLDLPGEVTKSAATPPVPPAAVRDDKPATAADKKAAVKSESPAPAADDLDLTSASGPEAAAAPAGGAGTGINRFSAVDLKLAGGSAPSSQGLKWLADKGYRTVLDLRESSEVPSSFIAEVTRMGLRYVALPINLETIDRTHVERFNFEVAIGEARPLFFFDSDGTRAGALWYIRRISNDRLDHQIARREAEGLGLAGTSAWAAATNYLSRLNAPRTSAIPSAPARTLADPIVSMSIAEIDEKSAGPRDVATTLSTADPDGRSKLSAGPAAAAEPTQPVPAPFAAQSDRSQSAHDDSAASSVPSFAVAWRPFAAMVISGLAVPLAYLSRTVTPTLVSKARASLPGSGRQPKSLPGESGA
jgi:protein tyrosine phosphatase (PTP) superfamily phosphohydrolase (DUF442 family)